MKVLVTGATGFIGRNLVEAWRERYDVLGPPRRALDLLDTESVRAYLRAEKPDVVVHSATTPGHRNAPPVPDLALRNLRMFTNLAEHAGSFGRMIVLGSGAEYDGRHSQPKMREAYFGAHVPVDETGFSKFLIARAVQARRGWVHLRPFGVFGPHEDWEIRFISNAICKALHGLPITLRQDRLFDYVSADDLGAVIAHFIDHPANHRDYNVTPDSATGLHALAELVRDVTGADVPIEVAQPGCGAEYSGDNARLKAELPGFSFAPLRDSIERLAKFYAQHLASIDRAKLLTDK